MATGDFFALVLITPIIGREFLRCCFIDKASNKRMEVSTIIEGAWCLVEGLNGKMYEYLSSTEFGDIVQELVTVFRFLHCILVCRSRR